MKYLHIPGTDLRVSAICFGPATMGVLIDEDTSFHMLDTYVEHGGTILDTAHIYCDWLDKGFALNEKLIGKWLTARGMHKKIIVATKGGHYTFTNPGICRVTRQEVLKDINESLALLHVDCIDFYWLHRDNPVLPVGEILEFMNEFKRQGLIKWFGGSNWTMERLAEADDYAKKKGVQGFSGVQNRWSLAVLNTPPADLTCEACAPKDINYYRQTGMTLFAYTSQASGFFSKMAVHDPDSLPPSVKAAYLNEPNVRKLAVVKELAEKYKCSINDIVLGYMTSQDFTCIPVFNCSSLEQLKDVLRKSDMTLTREDVLRLSTP